MPENNDTPELKPCPFCGNTNLRVMSAWTINESNHDGYAVHCSLLNKGCGATGRYSIETLRAVESWNARVSPL